MLDAIKEFRRAVGRPKAVAPKVHVGFRLAADVVASIKASGPELQRPCRASLARGRLWR